MTNKKHGVDTDESDKETYDAAREFTEEKDLEDNPVTHEDIKFLVDVIKKEAPCDETAIKQLWYGMNSGLIKSPLPHNVNSRVAGAGKSYDLILVSKYIPTKYLVKLNGISDKAIFHQGGTLVIENELTGETERKQPQSWKG
jgi:hypothetical protein